MFLHHAHSFLCGRIHPSPQARATCSFPLVYSNCRHLHYYQLIHQYSRKRPASPFVSWNWKRGKEQFAVVFITHQIELIINDVDRILLLHHGKLTDITIIKEKRSRCFTKLLEKCEDTYYTKLLEMAADLKEQESLKQGCSLKDFDCHETHLERNAAVPHKSIVNINRSNKETQMNSYPFFQTLDDVFASLRYHFKATATVTIVVGLFVAALCLNSQFGITMYRHTQQQASLMDGKRIIVTAAGAESPVAKFKAAHLGQIQEINGVVSVEPFYEVFVDMKHHNKSTLTMLESALPQDPVFAVEKFVGGVAMKNDKEIVLTQPLADSLGIEKTGETVTVSMERSNEGQKEAHELELTVSGIIKGELKGYVLLPVAESFDLWASYKTKNFAEVDTGDQVFPGGIVYLEDSRALTAQTKLHELGLISKRIRTYYFPQETTSDLNGYVSDEPEKIYTFQNAKEWNYWQGYAEYIPVTTKEFRCVHCLEIHSEDRPMTQEVFDILNTMRTEFIFARPALNVAGTLCGKNVTFSTAAVNEPIKEFYPNWFSSSKEPQALLGEDVMQNKSIKIGSSELLIFDRTAPNGETETLRIPVKVAGYAPQTVLPSPFAQQVSEWKNGLLDYSNGQFLSLDKELPEHGTVRAKLYVKDIGDVDAVATLLRKEGFQVNHNSDASKDIAAFANRMCLLVGIASVVPFVLAVISLFASGCLVSELKKKEMNALLSMGICRSRLMVSCIVEGGIFVFISLAFAVPLIMLSAPFCQNILETVFHLPQGAFALGLTESEGITAFGIAAVAAVALCSVSELFPLYFCWREMKPHKC